MKASLAGSRRKGAGRKFPLGLLGREKDNGGVANRLLRRVAHALIDRGEFHFCFFGLRFFTDLTER